MKNHSEKESLTYLFKDNLENRRGETYETDSSNLRNVFAHLFDIMREETAEALLHDAYRDRKKGGWFYDFHKSLRQVDVYNDCYRLDDDPQLDASEEVELKMLNEELNEVHEKMSKFERKLHDAIPAITDPTYPQKQAEFDVKYKLHYNELWSKEKNRRRYDLNQKLRNKEKTSINGHLDMILWNMINVDKENVFKETMEKTFEDYLRQKRRAIVKKSAVKK